MKKVILATLLSLMGAQATHAGSKESLYGDGGNWVVTHVAHNGISCKEFANFDGYFRSADRSKVSNVFKFDEINLVTDYPIAGNATLVFRDNSSAERVKLVVRLRYEGVDAASGNLAFKSLEEKSVTVVQLTPDQKSVFVKHVRLNGEKEQSGEVLTNFGAGNCINKTVWIKKN